MEEADFYHHGYYRRNTYNMQESTHMREHIPTTNLNHSNFGSHHGNNEDKHLEFSGNLPSCKAMHYREEHSFTPKTGFSGMCNVSGRADRNHAPDNVPVVDNESNEKSVSAANVSFVRDRCDTSSLCIQSSVPQSDIKSEMCNTLPETELNKMMDNYYEAPEVEKSDSSCRKVDPLSICSTSLEEKESSTTSPKQKSFKCNNCDETFYGKGALKSHSLIHKEKKSYECDICHKTYSKKVILDTHRKIHSGEKPYECNICHKSFTQKGTLKIHSMTHTGEKPFKCDVCQKSFNQRGALKIHYVIHSGEKPYECYLCHKFFTQQGALKTHLRTHTGEKPYKCDVCQKTFAQKGALKIHCLIHSGDYPYKCNTCDKVFNQKGAWKKHSAVHSEQILYECKLCNKSFAYKFNLREHALSHAGKKSFSCNICDKTFAKSSLLKKHTLLHEKKNLINEETLAHSDGNEENSVCNENPYNHGTSEMC